MKKTILIIVLFTTLLLSGCSQYSKTTHANGVPIYFLEPDGYIIVFIDDGSFLGVYGYITNDDLQAYKNGELKYSICVQNAYTTNKYTYVTVSRIKDLTVGEYYNEDLKDYYD